MKQLTGVDLSFLLMETDHTYGHVNGLSIYERPSDDFDPFTVVRERLSVMVSHLEPLRRKLVTVPFDLDRPYWIEDADFDIDFHVRHLGLAPPGAADQLAEQVARIVGRRMDRTRPLWEAYVIEGLADGRWALLQKTHHATIDGASGVIMLTMMTDETRDAPWELVEQPWTGEQPPPKAELLATALKNLAVNPVRGARLSLNVVREFADAAGVSSVSGIAGQARAALGSIGKPTDDRPSVSLPVTPAPPTPWNKTVSPHRRFAMRSTALENLKRLKNATGGTLNDVVMAICTGALREYLIEHDALPDRPLRAMVPVSIRTGEEENPWTNRVSGIVADLPTNCADPIERVALCREAMNVAKSQFDLMPAEALGQATDYASPIVAASAIRLVSSMRLADRVNSPINVVISNVPGPRTDLYFAGAKLDSYIPVSTISDGVGLNITVHSYADSMDFGLIACRELVPDLWHLVDLHIAEVERLFEATGAEWAVPQPPPVMRYGGDGVDPVEPRGEVVTRYVKKSAPATAAPSKASVTKQSPVKKKAPVTKKAAATKASVKKQSS
ncbi:MAG: wax ester/triacylglycerol synthase family O-acyltransferase [Ilumatobacteraceae bacterium]